MREMSGDKEVGKREGGEKRERRKKGSWVTKDRKKRGLRVVGRERGEEKKV